MANTGRSTTGGVSPSNRLPSISSSPSMMGLSRFTMVSSVLATVAMKDMALEEDIVPRGMRPPDRQSTQSWPSGFRRISMTFLSCKASTTVLPASRVSLEVIRAGEDRFCNISTIIGKSPAQSLLCYILDGRKLWSTMFIR